MIRTTGLAHFRRQSRPSETFTNTLAHLENCRGLFLLNFASESDKFSL